MIVKSLLTGAVTALIGLTPLNTQAASIWLEPTNQDTTVGGTANLELWADASDLGGFLAGGIDVFYYLEEYPSDPNKIPVLEYNDDFVFDVLFPTDPFFSRTGDDCTANPAIPGCSGPGEINGIAFGDFNGIAANGPTLVGTLSFTGVNLGYTEVHILDNDYPAGSWFATDGTDLSGLVNYGSAVITVVPLPAAVWLFGIGLIGLIGVARRRK